MSGQTVVYTNAAAPMMQQQPVYVQQQPVGVPGQQVIIVQQQAPTIAMAPPSTWRYDFCGCCDNVNICCYVYWCYPCAACEAFEQSGGGDPIAVFCCSGDEGLIILARRFTAQKYNIMDNVDCCQVLCCPHLSLIQVLAEQRFRMQNPVQQVMV